MRHPTILFPLLFCLAYFSPSAFAVASVDPPKVSVSCAGDQAGGFWWRYCVHKVETSTSLDAIYYFHGANGSEYEWGNSPAYSKIYELWGDSAPTVVTFSYGSLWLLAERNSSRYSGLYENFVQTALPRLEQSLNLHPAHRMLMGLSMGGFNAAELYLKNPNLFTKVGLACPAILSISPFASSNDINQYIGRTGASSSYVYNAINLFQSYFPTKSDWAKADPVSLASQSTNANGPPLYASIGLQDQYGFFEGAEAFVAAASGNEAVASLVTLPGPHCTFDAEGTALFFITP